MINCTPCNNTTLNALLMHYASLMTNPWVLGSTLLLGGSIYYLVAQKTKPRPVLHQYQAPTPKYKNSEWSEFLCGKGPERTIVISD